MKCCQVIVQGKVQGVFYRVSTKEKAESLGVRGWVQNLPNGNVEIHAEANEESIDQLIEWCKKGPILSKVDAVKVEVSELKNYQNFEVRY